MNEELLVSVIKSINDIKGHFPGKKELQKTIYLLQAKGINMGYPFRFHFYGPYSDALDTEIKTLAIQGILSVNASETTHRIAVNNADDYNGADANIEEVIKELREVDPLHLELMSTIVYLHKANKIDVSDTESVLEGVYKVKGKKYTDEDIRHSTEQLISAQYI